MIHDLDRALRGLLLREPSVLSREVDIQFHRPDGAWSQTLNKPTINLFLYDLRENTKLRHAAQGWDIERTSDGKTIQRRKPLRLDLHYLITAWVRDEPAEEHQLLGQVLVALFRTPEFPQDLLPESLRDQPSPITLEVAQHDTGENLSELWNALGNSLRPAIFCTVTAALNPYAAIRTSSVRTRELRVGEGGPGSMDTCWTIGGLIYPGSDMPIDALRLTLMERGPEVIPLHTEMMLLWRGAPPKDGFWRQFVPEGLEQGGAGPGDPSKGPDISLSENVVVRPDDRKRGSLETDRSEGEHIWHVDDRDGHKSYHAVWQSGNLSIYRAAARFAISSLQAGNYTLRLRTGVEDLRRWAVVVPAPDYVFEV